MKVRSDWLTSARVRRLIQILLKVSSLPPDISQREVERTLWRDCGGPLQEVETMVGVLADLRLIRTAGAIVKRTQAGDRVVRAIRAKDESLFALTLIRAGYFHDQARIFIETGKIDLSGNLRCPVKVARAAAPQLLGLLETWENVQFLPEVVVPELLLQELNTVWALLPPPVELSKWAAERKQVGDRAEMYTVQYERTRVGASAIFWVSRDSDALGWDVEDRSVIPQRCIEVKGRRDTEVVFYLSENEWKKAHELGASYEIQFWGGIDISIDPSVEYSALRANGFPFVIANISAELGQNWHAVPVNWRITRRLST